jgi:hypothetical protein
MIERFKINTLDLKSLMTRGLIELKKGPEKPQGRVNGYTNGRANITLIPQPVLPNSIPFTLENLELTLKTRYDNVEVREENAWIRKTTEKGYYNISVNIQGEQTAEDIKDFMFSMFGKTPLGGHLNYENSENIHLFQYYNTQDNVFNIGFYHIIPPRR